MGTAKEYTISPTSFKGFIYKNNKYAIIKLVKTFMAEFNEAPIAPPKQERPTVRQRLKNVGGRIMQFVRPNRNFKLPEQAFMPAAAAESDKKINPERALHISEAGCGVRAIMSAAAFASGENNISATTSNTAPIGEEGEWDMRIKQIKEGRKPVELLSKDLMDLYAAYARHSTSLGNALRQVKITQFNLEGKDMIKNRIKAGEQIMVFRPDSDPKKSHICHVGLDKRGRFISFSDEKRSKKRYQPADLSGGGLVVFSVTPNGVEPLPTNVRSDKQLALAA